jgi:hypothetical protein
MLAVSSLPAEILFFCEEWSSLAACVVFSSSSRRPRLDHLKSIVITGREPRSIIGEANNCKYKSRRGAS